MSRRAFLGAREEPSSQPNGDDEGDLNMCGVLVHAMPQRIDSVREALERMAGVAIHQILPQGRMIVTVEDTAGGSAIDSLAALHAVPGVVAAALVYHQFEPARVPGRGDQETRS
ncbi:MAG: chaperone NapD [Alphaproteobacteria bacterium]|nr:chaperone NapD [Alphaproteobacteria bacterium]